MIRFSSNRDLIKIIKIAHVMERLWRERNISGELLLFAHRPTMQLFLRAQNTHTLDVTGEETVGELKVHIFRFGFTEVLDLNCCHYKWKLFSFC